MLVDECRRANTYMTPSEFVQLDRHSITASPALNKTVTHSVEPGSQLTHLNGTVYGDTMLLRLLLSSVDVVSTSLAHFIGPLMYL